MKGKGAQKRSSSNAVNSRAYFYSTCWSTVRRAGAPGPDREDALDRLVRQYRPAMKHYLRTRFGLDASTADDVVQGFLLDKVLKRNLLHHAARERGKFRTFLLTAINRYAVDHFRRAGAKKRIPANVLVPLDGVAEQKGDNGACDQDTSAFDNAFVRQVLAMAVWRLRHWCNAGDPSRDAVWEVFYRRILEPLFNGGDPQSYTEIVADPEVDLGSAGEARNRLTTAKRILRRELQSIVADYSNDSAEAEEELEQLRRLIGE